MHGSQKGDRKMELEVVETMPTVIWIHLDLFITILPYIGLHFALPLSFTPTPPFPTLSHLIICFCYHYATFSTQLRFQYVPSFLLWGSEFFKTYNRSNLAKPLYPNSSCSFFPTKILVFKIEDLRWGLSLYLFVFEILSP